MNEIKKTIGCILYIVLLLIFVKYFFKIIEYLAKLLNLIFNSILGHLGQYWFIYGSVIFIVISSLSIWVNFSEKKDIGFYKKLFLAIKEYFRGVFASTLGLFFGGIILVILFMFLAYIFNFFKAVLFSI